MEPTAKEDEHGEERLAVLPGKMGGGPHGLGDPNDRSLRKVEIEILIPKKIRSKAKEDKCIPEVKAFEECCKSSGIAMVATCRKENAALKTCLTHWYQDDQLRKECTEEYLKERSYYRATGIRKSFSRM